MHGAHTARRPCFPSLMIRALLTFPFVALISTCAAADARGIDAALRDETRQRDIPTEIRLPENPRNCVRGHLCPVAFVSPGYGLAHTDYRFLSDTLVELGYLVVSMQSVLPGDPKPPNTGNAIADRTPMWTVGADNLAYAKSVLSERYPGYDWARLVLVGHSNGGDLSALALKRDPSFASVLITLDNRRYPLPTSEKIRLLSIRGSDFEADAGVLPLSGNMRSLSRCIVEIPESRHDDMNDAGPAWLKKRIAGILVDFLRRGRCKT